MVNIADCLTKLRDPNSPLPKFVKEEFERLYGKYEAIEGAEAAGIKAFDKIQEKLKDQQINLTRQAYADAKVVENVNSRLRENFSGKDAYRAGVDTIAQRTGNERGVARSFEYEQKAVENLFVGMMPTFSRKFTPTVVSALKRMAKPMDEAQRIFDDELYRAISGLPKRGNLDPELQKLVEQIAREWQEVGDFGVDLLRGAGVKIGKIENYFPHKHDLNKFKNATQDEYVNFARGLMDRKKMSDAADGIDGQELDDHITDVLTATYEHSKRMDTGFFGTASKEGGYVPTANPLGGYINERVLHFTEEGWGEYAKRFGTENTTDIMVSHLKQLARDIALSRVLGPSPQDGIKKLKAHVKNLNVSNTKRWGGDTDKHLDQLYDLATGAANTPASEGLAKFFGAKFTIDSVTALVNTGALSIVIDTPATLATLASRNASAGSMVRHMGFLLHNLARHETKHKMAEELAFVADSFLENFQNPHHLEEAISYERLRHWATASFRASGLQRVTSAARSAASFSHALNFSEMLLEHKGIPFFNRYGISEDEMRWLKNNLSEHGGRKFIIPKKIARENPDLAIKWESMIRYETEMSVVSGAGMYARKMMFQGTKPGTAGRIGLQSAWQFKGAMVQQMIQIFQRLAPTYETRALGAVRMSPGEGSTLVSGKRKAAIFGSMGASMIAGGMLYVQFSQIARGKEPYEIDDAELWGLAIVKSGMLGSSEVMSNMFNYNDDLDLPGGLLRAGGGMGGSQVENLFRTLNSIRGIYEDEEPNATLKAGGVLAGQAGAAIANVVVPNVIGLDLIGRRLIEEPILNATDPQWEARMDKRMSRMEKKSDRSYWWPHGQSTP